MSTEPTPAPADPDAFDEWARQATDAWQRVRVYEEVERRLADPSTTVSGRAMAAVWGAPVGMPPVEELSRLADDQDMDDVLRARVKATLASASVQSDPDEAVRLVEEVLPVASDASVHVRTRLSLWFTAGEVYGRLGRPADAMAVLDTAAEQLGEAGSIPGWALPAVDIERAAIGLRAGADPEQVGPAVEQVAAMAGNLPATPTSVDVVIKAAGILTGLGAIKRAEAHYEKVIDQTSEITEAQGARYQALTGLADARMRIDGPEAAMEVQRQAIAAVEPLGDSPMLAWARRGLAGQMLATDEFRAAADEFAEAAAVYARIGMDVDAGALRLEQAGALVHADEPDAARVLADEVAAAAEELSEPQSLALEMRLHHVYAQLSAYEGELEDAADHWLEVADRATRSGASPLEAQLAAAQLFAAADDMDEAAAQFARAELSAAEADDPAAATALVMRTHAETLREAGRADEAAEMARIAANHARSSGDEAQAIYLTVVAADSLHAAGESQAAVHLYEDTLRIAEAAGMPSLLGAVHAAFANLLRDLGRSADAAEQEAKAAALGIAPQGSEKLSR